MDGADDAARQEQRHGDEQATEHEQPIRRENAAGEIGFAVVHQHRPEYGAGQRSPPADCDPDHSLDGIARREFARVDDADLRDVERAGDACHAGRQRENEHLISFDPVAEKTGARFGVANGDQNLAEFGAHDDAADDEAEHQRQHGSYEQRRPRRCRLDVEAQDVLEVGETVIAAEAEIIAEEAEHQREGQRLGDDREVNASDAAAECEPAENESEQAGHQHDHESRVGEMLEPIPVDRQLRPIQEHHEVGEHGMRVNSARSDLPHQIHAHRIAAEREERAVAERKNAAVAPDQVNGQRQ